MANKLFNECVINADELYQQLSHPDLLILHTDMQPIGFEVTEPPQGSLPLAMNVDVDRDISDTSQALPHSLPTAQHFTHLMQNLGVNQHTQIVVYDDYGIYSAPRLWWLLTAMGHKNVYVLNGGLSAWKASGYTTQSFFSTPTELGNFKAHFDENTHISAKNLLQGIEQKQRQPVDARSEDRFYGRVPEPRVGLRQGHIPSAISLPFQSCLIDDNPINGLLKTKADLMELFTHKGLTVDHHLVFSCGSGITACIPLLAATWCGFKQLALYDGSWSEWGADDTLPIE